MILSADLDYGFKYMWFLKTIEWSINLWYLIQNIKTKY